MQRVEVRVGLEGASEIPGRGADVPERALDHARVIEEPRIARAEAERFGHGGPGRLRLAVLVEGPREEVLRVDVAADVELPAGKGQGRVELRVVVQVEGRELAVVQNLIELGEPPDVLDELVLAPLALEVALDLRRASSAWPIFVSTSPSAAT